MALLEITDLSHNFGGLRAVSNFSLKVAEGEMAGLIGPNGAGKTTVFNLITGVYHPAAGQISFLGRDISRWSSYRIMGAGMGRTFQNIRLFKDLSVLDNVRLGASGHYKAGLLAALLRTRGCRRAEDEITARALTLLTRFGLASYARQPARSLPYGEQRRLEMARALISRPRLLLLDEPAAGMNQAETEVLIALLRQIQKEFDLAVLLIEHHMGVVMNLCHHITVLDFGETICAGPPAVVQRHPAVLEAYLGKDGFETEGAEAGGHDEV